MKIIKQTIRIIIFLIIVISSQSCSWLISKTQGDYCKQWGYITDTNGVGIPNVKITVLMAVNHLTKPIETNRIFYTDQEGFYDIYIDNSDSVYYMKMTHDEYIYPIPQPQLGYPQIAYANIQLEDELYNFEMVKKGKVKIEGDVMCDYCDTFFVSNVKISILRRLIGNTNYPDTIGISTYTNENGYYHIEYDGDTNYNYFIKPEKEGYYYEWREFDYAPAPNIDPGYIISGSLKILQVE